MKARSVAFAYTRIAVCIALASLFLSGGCALRTVTPPDGMTSDEAKEIIASYLEDSSRRLWNRTDGIRVEDDSFTRLVRLDDSGEDADRDSDLGTQTVRYADLGDFEVVYRGVNALFFIGFGSLGPTFVEVRQSDRGLRDPELEVRFEEEDGRLRTKNVLWSFIPLWVVFPGLWVRSDEEIFFEALTFMKNRQAIAGGARGSEELVTATH